MRTCWNWQPLQISLVPARIPAVFTWSSSKRSFTLGLPLDVLPLAFNSEDWSWCGRGGEDSVRPTGSKPNRLQFTFSLWSVIFAVFVKVEPSVSLLYDNLTGSVYPWRVKLHSGLKDHCNKRRPYKTFWSNETVGRQIYAWSTIVDWQLDQSGVVNDNRIKCMLSATCSL